MTTTTDDRRTGRPAPLTLVLLAAALASSATRGATITVNSAADTTGGAPCTLRDALTAANTNAAAGGCVAGAGASDVIQFAIPAATDPGCNAGTGVCTLKPVTSLPFVASVVDLNGFTQTGASANTLAANAYPNALGLNAQIRIELDGSLAPGGAAGLRLIAGSNGSRVRGLAIHSFGTAVFVNAGSVLVNGNYLGTHADGVTPGVQATGVDAGGSNVTIGGSAAADRNLVTAATVCVIVSGGTGTSIIGNLIGTDRTGTVALGTGTGLVNGSLLQDNLVSGNAGSGILLQGTSFTNVLGNTVGIAVGGAPLGNLEGLDIQDAASGSSNVTVVSGNGIANNASDGIVIHDFAAYPGAPSGVNIDGSNAIWNNVALGINLRPQGEASGIVTPNDALDADTGPDGLQNFPVITSATRNANGSITVAFTLDSFPGGTFGITALANADCSAASDHEGRYPSGQIAPNVQADGAGHASGSLTIPSPLPTGWGTGSGISLTARDTSSASTSEFSACAVVINATPVELQLFDAE